MDYEVISVKDLNKSFKNKLILNQVNFKVNQGEIFALLGQNGAGKTTIINILSTLMKPDGGEIRLCGFDIYNESENIRKSISLTGQFSAVDDMQTGKENLIMIAKLRKISNPLQIVEYLLNKFGLNEAANKRVDKYSGGMRRKLDIAMSLIGKPKVIFLDEPTTGLDPEARIEVWRTINDLADGGTTIFLTTQYLEEAENLADRIAILHNGTIIKSGTLTELKKIFPPIKVEYVEKQPSLEEIFLKIIGEQGGSNNEK